MSKAEVLNMTSAPEPTIQNPAALLDNMADGLKQLMVQRGIEQPCMIGIHSGGAWVAKALHEKLNIANPLGSLNITFYRDDFTRIGIHPQVEPSNLPFEVDDQHIILVDDVLHTGRTIRAALNEIFDYGRPASVILAVMVERDGRELPIAADIRGTNMELAAHQHIKLSGPEPLELILQESV